MSGRLVARVRAKVEARAARRREAILRAVQALGVDDARIEGDAVLLSGRGLMRRWMSDLALRESGRDGL